MPLPLATPKVGEPERVDPGCGAQRRLPPPEASEVNRRTYEELARIGNNLNQLVRAVHAKAVAVVDAGLLHQLADAVRRLGLEVLGAGVR